MILSLDRAAMRSVVVFFALVLQWLNPFVPGPSPSVFPWLITLAAAAVVVLLGSVYTRRFEDTKHGAVVRSWFGLIAWSWLVAGLVSTVIGLIQYFGVAAVFEPWINQTVPGVAFANLRQRNQFATLTSIALAALVSMVAAGRLSKSADAGISNRHLHWMACVAACLLAAGNAASASRTGLMQLGLICLLSGLWGHWKLLRLRNMLLYALFVYILMALLLPVMAGFDLSVQGMLARLRAGDSVCASRITLWSNVLHLIGQKPWLGWGWGELDYAHYITLYDGPRFCDILDNAHNLPLHLAVELGIPVAVVLCGAFIWWVVRQAPWSEKNPARQLAWAVLALIFLHSMLEYPLWYGPFQMATGLCVYLLWLNPRESVKTAEYASNRALAPISCTFLAIVLIAISAYAAWDYHRISQVYLAPEKRDAAYRDDTLSKIQDSRLFRNQVLFAELSLTPLTPANAQWTFDTASELLHFSPEPKVIEKIIESATMLGRDEVAIWQLARYRAAFPAEHARWVSEKSAQPRI